VTKKTKDGLSARDRFDLEQAADAAYFTVCVYLGRARYDTTRCATRGEMDALALSIGRDEHGRRPLRYAVTAAGRSIPLDGLPGWELPT
jgi:hypothetical protein